MSATEYAHLYTAYWDRPDRWGTHSFSEPEVLVDQILALCGGGKLLDIGCGMGLLVQTLLRRGVDAQGIDVAPRPIEHANRVAPGRFRVGSVLELPFADGAFDTLVSTNVLEHLAKEDLPTALRELYRVARRFVFLTVSTAADRDNRWHLTIHDRAWWENQLFQAGFRKHPLAQAVWPYESLERDGTSISIAIEKVPPAALAKYPLETLAAERDLHMDMLRETGRRAEAHVARYQWAAQYVRPGDVVLDAACGLGYGSALLASGTAAARVLGVDHSAYAIEYARAHYGADGLEFQQGDAADLSFLPDRSVDLVVSMETLEHLPDPSAFLQEARRALRPSGRLLVSVPNEWVDESGRDPNPHHLHVYTWAKLREQLERYFLCEQFFAQTAGGGLKLGDQPRRLREVAVGAESDTSAEWWLAVAMKDPVGFDKQGYRETSFPDHSDLEGYNITAFGRDYDNPWLVKALVSIGMRNLNPLVLERLARHVLELARPGSADAGAALCVLGYRLLEQPGLTETEARSLLERIEDYHRRADDTPHAWRWRISNQYVAGVLLLATGQPGRARDAFLQCAELDCLEFSPLLATKTVDALFRAGLIDACRGELDAAGAAWRRALLEAHRVLSGSWVNIWGRPDRVIAFGLPEATQVLDLATRCAYGLVALQHWHERPGYAWSQAVNNFARELRYWQRLSAERYSVIGEQEQVAARQRDTVAGLEASVAGLRADAERRQAEAGCLTAQVAHAQQRIAELQADAAAERANMQAALDGLAADCAALRATVEQREAELHAARARHEHVLGQAQTNLDQLQVRFNELQAWMQKVDVLHAERCQQVAALQQRLDEIGQSTGWALLQVLYKVRFFLFPRASRRERLARWCMHKQRRFRYYMGRGPGPLARAVGRTLRRGFSRLRQAVTPRPRPMSLPPAGQHAGFAGEVPGLVSVILPVYNQASLLRESIESVLVQTYADFELVVIDDGSKDDVAGVLNQYTAHPKVRILTQENQKLPKALSNGFDFARGEFWTWTSADNLMEPQQLEKQVAFLRAHSDAGMVYCDYLAIDERGLPLRDPSFRRHNRRTPNSPEIHLPRDTATLNTVQDNFIGACFMYRGWVGRVLGDYTPILGVEDYDYWMRANDLFSIRHIGTDEPLYRYRVHDNTLNAQAREHHIFERVQRLMWYEQARQSYFKRPWKVFVDSATHAWLEGVNTAGHSVRRLAADGALAPEREEVLLIVRAETLEQLDDRSLPKEHCVAVWFDEDALAPYRFGHMIQRRASLCFAANSAMAERLALFTRHVFLLPPGQTAFDLVVAFGSNDLFARKTLPAEDCVRRLPQLYLPAGRRLRVLLQTQDFVQGGLERVVLDLAAVLDPAEFDVSLLILGQEGPLAAEARAGGLRVLQLPAGNRTAAYRQLLREQRIDVINAHYSLFGAEIAAELEIPFLQTVHNAYVWFTPEDIAAYQQADAHTTAYVCVSSTVAWYAEQRLGLSPTKMLVVPNGIDRGALDGARERIDRKAERARLGYGADHFVFVCTASVAAVKGQLHLVRALAEAVQCDPRIKVALLGRLSDDEYVEMVRGEIRRYGLENAVRWLGHRDDPHTYLLAADGFVLPSFVEGWSLALAEALYAGLPCVATDVGAARELLTQTGGHVITLPLRSMLDYDYRSFAEFEKSEHPGFVRDIATALVAVAEDPEPPALGESLEAAIDRAQAFRAYADLFKWVALGGHATAVRPLIWELHGVRRGDHQLTSDPLGRRRHVGWDTRAGGPEARDAFRPVERPVAEVCERARGSRGAIVFLLSIDWSQWLFQRPHHLARHFARQGYTVIYDDSNRFTGFSGFKEIEPNLYLYRGLADQLLRIPDPVLWAFCYNYQLAERFAAGTPVIYDLIDDFAVHPYDPQLMQRNHRRALQQATVVAYVARHLETFVQARPDRLYLPNGVEDEFFADERLALPHDPQLRRILKDGKPIAGYYGALAEWFDYELLERTARLRPDWNFVLIGPKYDLSLENKPALRLPNVQWIGPRDYAVLPAYLRAFDVATIPFAINEITLATSPLKLYEYFAGGKPVVTTPMPECMAFPEVRIVRNAEEFAAALNAAREQGQDPDFRAHLRELARQNSWAERVRAVEGVLRMRNETAASAVHRVG